MARCPGCNTEQDTDFGMTTCTQCGAVYMVGIDGEVEVSGGQETQEEVHFEEPSSGPEELQASEEVGSLETMVVEPSEEPTAEEENIVEEVPSEYSEDFLNDLSSTTPAPATDPLDIQRFDEVGASQMEDGEYLYDVVVTGIDSADLKKEVLRALSEKRFALSMSDLQKEIQKGELNVPNLNPVRAMLIVLRLQNLDLTIEWRQKHFTQDEGEEKSEAEL